MKFLLHGNGIKLTEMGSYYLETLAMIDPYVFGSCNVLVVYGCMDSTAQNYNPQATDEDSSCVYSFLGCTDSLSCNYNPQAIIDDSSCYCFEIDLGNDTILCSISNFKFRSSR